MRKCPRCAADVPENSKVCVKCGLPVSKMDKFLERSGEVEFAQSSDQNAYSSVMTAKEKRAQKKAEKQQKKLEKKQAKKEKKLRESVSDTDFSIYALNNKNGVRKKYYENSFAGRRQRAKDKSKYPEFTIDAATGEFNIDTSDVEIVGDETSRMIEQQHNSYSVKTSRGDYTPKKIKWWELYKLADRHFARRKIKKQVNAAAKIKPSFISKTKLVIFSLLFGWLGVHNFYAKNYKKGAFSIITLLISMLVFILAPTNAFFASIQLSVGGCAGFLNLFVWISDFINIVFGGFKYRIQKEAFLCKLNFNTRAKLGEKYYDMDLYKQPFWVRFKVWCERRKRDFEESKRERKQRKIDKEKKKQEAQRAAETEQETVHEAESASDNSEAQNAEQQKLRKMRSKVMSSETMMEINSFDGMTSVSNETDKNGAAKKKTNSAKSAENAKGEGSEVSSKPKRQARLKVNTKKGKKK